MFVVDSVDALTYTYKYYSAHSPKGAFRWPITSGMYCILRYLIIKLTCSIEETLCGNAIKTLLLLLLLLLLLPTIKYYLLSLD
jgi:hypothetical protein